MWLSKIGHKRKYSLFFEHNHHAVQLHPTSSLMMLEPSRLDEAQTGVTVDRRNINNLRYADDTTLMAETKQELKSLLMKVKEESEKSWLKTQHSKNKDHGVQSHHFMSNRWGNNGNSDNYFLDFKITVDGECNEIKRHLLLGRKALANLDSILQSKDITLPTKVCLVNAMVFPVVMYGCESWTIEKTECQKIDAFELWCWRRHLSVPWTARRWNQSILKEISPEYSLEGLMLKLKLQYFSHLMQRIDSLGRILLLGKIEGRGRRLQQRLRRLDVITDSMDISLIKLQVMVKDRDLACYDLWSHKDSDTTEWLNTNHAVRRWRNHIDRPYIGILTDNPSPGPS